MDILPKPKIWFQMPPVHKSKTYTHRNAYKTAHRPVGFAPGVIFLDIMGEICSDGRLQKFRRRRVPVDVANHPGFFFAPHANALSLATADWDI